jgi:hypothetical protein
LRKGDNKRDIYSEDEASYTTQCQKAYLRYVENQYCAKHRCLPVIESESFPSKNLFPSTMASRFGQSSFGSYDLFNDDEEYIVPNM